MIFRLRSLIAPPDTGSYFYLTFPLRQPIGGSAHPLRRLMRLPARRAAPRQRDVAAVGTHWRGGGDGQAERGADGCLLRRPAFGYSAERAGRDSGIRLRQDAPWGRLPRLFDAFPTFSPQVAPDGVQSLDKQISFASRTHFRLFSGYPAYLRQVQLSHRIPTVPKHAQLRQRARPAAPPWDRGIGRAPPCPISLSSPPRKTAASPDRRPERACGSEWRSLK